MKLPVKMFEISTGNINCPRVWIRGQSHYASLRSSHSPLPLAVAHDTQLARHRSLSLRIRRLLTGFGEFEDAAPTT